MFVSRKNLALIHFVPVETATRTDVTQPPHQGVHFVAVAPLRGELHQPFPEDGIQRFVLRARHEPRLLDEVLVGAESDVLHTIIVYTSFVQSQELSTDLTYLTT